MLFFSFVGCEEDESFPTYKENYSTLYSFLEDNEEYSLFKAIVDTAIIEGTEYSMKSVYSSYNSNDGGSAYTLLLPSNQAVENYLMDEDITLEALLASTQECWNLSTHHLINRRIASSDFPNGEMADTSLNGATHIVRFQNTEDGVSYLVDELASVTHKDLYQSNGTVHVIDHVLSPLSLTSCEWLDEDGGYTIFVEALKITGLYDELQAIDTKLTPYTMFVEADSVFEREGLMSIDDLKAKFSPDNTDYESVTNLLYQFVAYHILDSKAVFITDMSDGKTNYDTFTAYPLSITLSSELSDADDLSDGVAINVGHIIYDSIPIIGAKDTTYLYQDYISIYEAQSNTPTLSGVIHFVNEILVVNTNVTPAAKTFNFREDPAIQVAVNTFNTYQYFEDEDLERFTFGGELFYISYYRSDDEDERASGQDYLTMGGNYEISFRTTKLTVGDYDLNIRVDVPKSSGLIEVYLDGKRIGTTINLNSLEAPNDNLSYSVITAGRVAIEGYEEHEVTLKAITPGSLVWDYLQFAP